MGGVLSKGRGLLLAGYGDDGPDRRKKSKTTKTTSCTSRLYRLPELVHDAITSCLTNKDMNHLMECGMWLMEAYGGRITSLNLCGAKKDCSDHEIILSFIERRPGVVSIKVDRATVGLLAEIMSRGCCNNKVEALDIALSQADNDELSEKEAEEFKELCRAFGSGACPKMTSLIFDIPVGPEWIVGAMGDALRSRMANGKGCCGLKSLTIEGFSWPLGRITPLLTSGACEALQHLEIDAICEYCNEDVEWLTTNKASQLITFTLRDLITPDRILTGALCSPGVAPKLQELRITNSLRAPQIDHLTNALTRGAWPELRMLSLFIDSRNGTATSRQALIEAIGVGAPKLKMLYLAGDGLDHDGVKTMAAALAQGAWPKLYALLLSGVKALGSQEIMEELCGAFERDVCNRLLRCLVLGWCDITPQAIRQLGEAVERGGLQDIRYLDLSDNNEIGDEGVVSLSQTMTRGRGLRRLGLLRLDRVGMTDEGARALFEGLGDQRVLPNLERMSLEGNDGMSDDVKRGLVEEMHAKRGTNKVRVDW